MLDSIQMDTYGRHMATPPVLAAEMVERVKAVMQSSDTSTESLATVTGIPYATLVRRLALVGATGFLAAELYAIAQALEVDAAWLFTGDAA